MSFRLPNKDGALLQRLEEDLWRAETRFDKVFMERVLAAEFFEIGRSGRIYDRETIINAPPVSFSAILPLPDLNVRLLTDDVAQVTYNSQITYDGVTSEYGRRSSIWRRISDGWVLTFHQGTSYDGPG